MQEDKKGTVRPVTVQASDRQMSDLEVLVRARYPLIYVISWEEQRVLSHIQQIAAKLGKNVFEWSITTGLVQGGGNTQSLKRHDAATEDPVAAIGNVIEYVEPALYVFKDFHPFLKSSNIAILRRLRGGDGAEEHLQDYDYRESLVRDAGGA